MALALARTAEILSAIHSSVGLTFVQGIGNNHLAPNALLKRTNEFRQTADTLVCALQDYFI
jgi:hypothetical protein